MLSKLIPKNLRKLNSEFEQAIIRFIACSTLALYTSFAYSRGWIDHHSIVTMYLASVLFCIVFLFWTYFDRGLNKNRLFLAMLTEIGTTTYALALSGEGAAPLIVVYFWLIFGNGIRQGRQYLFYHTVLTIVGFIVVISVSPYWSQHLYVSGGILLSMIILPGYMNALLRRLHNAVSEAEAANKAKTQFLANVSHELRTPLNGVVGMSDLLAMTKLDSVQKEYAATIQSSAKTLLSLIEDVLDLAKIEADKTHIENIKFDLYDSVRDAFNPMSHLGEKKGLKCRLRITAETPYSLIGDEMRLKQILLNLLGNSVKFTHVGSVELNISTIYVKGDIARIRFEITDTGIGIPSEAQNTIFEKFTQADPHISQKYGGTGLGTTISKTLVELMGGEIGLISTINMGSTFWFEIPFKHQPNLSVHSEIIHNSRILIVGMNDSRHSEFIQYLKDWQLDWDHATSSDEAEHLLSVAKYHNLTYTLILIDDSGIDIDSCSFAQRIKSNPNSKDIDLVLLTDKSYISNAPILNAGYFCVLNTPIDKRLLYNALHATSIRPNLDNNVTKLIDHQIKNRGNLKLNILVGEDNPTNQKVIGKILELAEHKVTIVSNGEEVLDALENGNYDLMILDMFMPEMGGLEAYKTYRFMKISSHEIPAIVLTANATQEALEKCKEAGISAFLTKPVDTTKLLTTIESIFSNKIKLDYNLDSSRNLKSNPSANNIKIIDIETLNSLSGLDDNINFMNQLITGFINDSSDHIKKLKIAIDKKNVDSIQDIVHALKGSARSIGAVALAQNASAVEENPSLMFGNQIFVKLKNIEDTFSFTQVELLNYLEQLKTAP